MKKEAALMAKEIERRQKEFMERQKMKQRIDGDKSKCFIINISILLF